MSRGEHQEREKNRSIGRAFNAWSTPAVFLVAATAAAVFAVLLADRFGPRLDATATSAHRLAPRTASIVSSLEGPWEIVLAADLSRADTRAAQQLGDVLATLETSAGAITTTIIDISETRGPERFERLLRRLAEEAGPTLDAQSSTVRDALGTLSRVSSSAEELSASLLAARDAITDETPGADGNRRFFTERAAAVRVLGPELDTVVARVSALIDPATAPAVGPLRIPRTDLAAEALAQPLEAVEASMRSLGEQLGRYTGSEAMPRASRDRAAPARDAAFAFAAQAATAAQRVGRMVVPDVLRVQTALASGEAALVIGPPGIAAVDLAALLPDPGLLRSVGLAGADVRRRAEELIATALASLVRPDAPIVIFAHGEARRFFGLAAVVEELRARLTLRGMDVLEWAAAIEPDAPETVSIDPLGVRPVVLVTLAPDASAGSGGNDPELSGAARAARYAERVRTLMDRGIPALVALNPSPLPGFGEPDPQNTLLEPFGLRAETGAPVLAEAFSESTRTVSPDRTLSFEVDPNGPAEALVESLLGLRILLPWPIAIVSDGSAASTPLLRIAGDARSWRESGWYELWATPRDARALLPRQPAFDEGRDHRDGPWTVALAAETTPAPDGAGKPRRIVVVGSNGWLVDSVTQQAAQIDGRVFELFPGNLELVEGSIAWLADRPDLLGRGTRTASVPTVSAMSEDRLRAVRLGVALLPSGLILGVGVLLRWTRG